jgi:peptide-methionine (R)-S-oxide reductase
MRCHWKRVLFFLLVGIKTAGAVPTVERPYSGEHVYRTDPGTYSCAGCSAPLFSSADKYDAGNGWPNFTRPIASEKVYYLEDQTLSFKRYEVRCRGCNGMLGHVFNDGPPPKHLRYCIPSAHLTFKNNS